MSFREKLTDNILIHPCYTVIENDDLEQIEPIDVIMLLAFFHHNCSFADDVIFDLREDPGLFIAKEVKNIDEIVLLYHYFDDFKYHGPFPDIYHGDQCIFQNGKRLIPSENKEKYRELIEEFRFQFLGVNIEYLLEFLEISEKDKALKLATKYLLSNTKSARKN